MPSPGLLDAPALVIDGICSFLDLRDIGNLRLTCQHLALFACGAHFRSSLTHRTIGLSSEYLTDFDEFGARQGLTPLVRSITVQVVVHDADREGQSPWLAYRRMDRQKSDWKAQWCNHIALSSRLRRRIAKFPSADFLGLELRMLSDLTSRPSWFDISRQSMRNDLQNLIQFETYFALKVLINALSTTTGQFKTLDLLGQDNKNLINMLSFYLALKPHPPQSLSAALSNLTSLSLALREPSIETHHQILKRPGENMYVERALCWNEPARFLSFCSGTLQTLKITYHRLVPHLQLGHRFRDAFDLHHLKLSEPISEVAFPVLRRLEMQDLTFAHDALVSFLGRLPRLEELSLGPVCLFPDGEGRGWESVFGVLMGRDRIGAPLRGLHLDFMFCLHKDRVWTVRPEGVQLDEKGLDREYDGDENERG